MDVGGERVQWAEEGWWGIGFELGLSIVKDLESDGGGGP